MLLSPALGWFIVVLVQLLVGGVAGTLLGRLLPPLLAWFVFHVFLLAGAFALADISAPFQALRSWGGWGFELGLAFGLLLCRRANDQG